MNIQVKFTKIIDLDKGIVEIDDQQIINNINKYLKKDKELLFKTEDGVDIYEGNEIYMVLPKANWSYQTFKFEKKHSPEYCKAWLKFSTKEKAEEYILMNKPCLSINDVIHNLQYTTSFKETLNFNINTFRGLVENKLKQNGSK